MTTDEFEKPEAVIVRLRLSDDEFGEWEEREAAYAVEDRLIEAFEACDAGSVDGHEFGAGFATIYVYGPSADRMAAIVLATVTGAQHRAGSVLIKRFGPPGAREQSVPLVEGAA